MNDYTLFTEDCPHGYAVARHAPGAGLRIYYCVELRRLGGFHLIMRNWDPQKPLYAYALSSARAFLQTYVAQLRTALRLARASQLSIVHVFRVPEEVVHARFLFPAVSPILHAAVGAPPPA